MTAILDQGQQQTLGEAVEVRFTPHGLPLAIRWRGRLWPVVAEPVHEVRRSDGPGVDAQDDVDGAALEVELWQLQVQATSITPLQNLELRQHPDGGWHVTHPSED
ncbi:hypothetical protein D477_010691 [Arthrobacter crystallopoietes BAB-32]|uniref:Uncharacterized protein n=1 Tax=Arthrobacter crystallopoietes BAB-32 TaxID=1246476 RepID=N1V2N1_9MICC|nr:hypothetical protein [Arthrobacter crystallopoietes]EMY34249.1 hypothetical protein D477_010691 [Arthrobacter crystallopoietes BAB-32]